MREFAGLCLMFAVVGCASSVRRLEDGSLRLECDSVLSTCMRQAEMHCRKDGGIHVLSASEKNTLYGVEGNQAGTLASRVVFVCNSDAPRKPIKLPPRPASSAEPPPATSAAPSRPAAPRQLCVPGSTQKCVGPGACVGGQACLPDGSGFGPCDCGPVNATQLGADDAGAGAQDAGAAGSSPTPAAGER